MPQRPVTISRVDARRLAVSLQHLDGPRRPPDIGALRGVLRSLRFLQVDPVKVVAPSHELVLWSRLGPGASPLLDELLWEQRWLYEYWIRAAAIVLTEDYPLHRVLMNGYRDYPPAMDWVTANERLRDHVLDRLTTAGPQPTSGFDDCAVLNWKSSGWNSGRNVDRMLHHLWRSGRVMVAGRAGGQRLWGLPETCLPADVDRTTVAPGEALIAAAEYALRAIGVAREPDTKRYAFGEQYFSLSDAFQTLRKRGRIRPVRLDGDTSPDDPWFVHVDVLDRLEAIRAGGWDPRTTLLAPFDNLINERIRVKALWDFDFTNEMYRPKAKRKYGYYLLAILHGERLVGRVAPRVDRRRKILHVEGLYLEPDVRPTMTLCKLIRAQLAELAAFAGACDVEYGNVVPERWRATLRRT